MRTRFVQGFSLLLAMVLTYVVVAPPARASHPTGRELASMHSGYVDEDICVNFVSGNDTTFEQTATRVKGSLYADTPPSGQQNWDALAWDATALNYRIYFWVLSKACGSLTRTERQGVEIEVWVEENTEDRCDYVNKTLGEGDGVNCVFHDDPTFGDADPNTNPTTHDDSNDFTHTDYAWSSVYFNDYWIGNKASESTWRHTINHEFGHVIGLVDGEGTCPGSIMHSISYGCSISYPWPQSSDITSVEYIANSR